MPTTANYPWGISNTANIITVRNATKEWVEEQGYGKNFLYKSGIIASRPPRSLKLTPFYSTSLTLNSAVTSFAITPDGTAGTAMREMYLVMTLGAGVTQPITWDASCDAFKGGSAAAVAPTEGLNFYHFIEYASGHFRVEKVI